MSGVEVAGNLVGGVSCPAICTFSTGGRWCNNGNGTVTDTTTGLIWLKSVPSPFVVYVASNSMDSVVYVETICNGVAGLTDGSAQGDWRLPTQKELLSLTTGAEHVAFDQQQLFTGIQQGYYWTTTRGSAMSEVWVVYFNNASGSPANGSVSGRSKSLVANTCYVWPVRSKL